MVFVTAALFLGVFTLRMLVDDAVDPYSMLYVLPVALAATAFGERAGILGALVPWR